MRRFVIWTGAALLSLSLITGCQSKSKERYTFRDTGIQQLNSENYEEAIASFGQALELSKGMVDDFELDVLKYRAEAEYKAGDYDAAAHSYSILIDVDGEKPEYLNNRCLSLVSAGKTGQALEDFTKSYALDKKGPGSEAALLALGAALEDQDRHDDAITLYNQALADGANNTEIYNRMGLCMMDEQNYDQAISCFEKGISAGEGDSLAELYFNQAVAYEYKGEFSKALELFERYNVTYGPSEQADREIAFLKTR